MKKSRRKEIEKLYKERSLKYIIISQIVAMAFFIGIIWGILLLVMLITPDSANTVIKNLATAITIVNLIALTGACLYAKKEYGENK